jgi:hypothetical protein
MQAKREENGEMHPSSGGGSAVTNRIEVVAEYTYSGGPRMPVHTTCGSTDEDNQ